MPKVRAPQYLPPASSAPHKASNADGYVMTFTKVRYDQYKLALAQAQAESEALQKNYKARLEMYQRQAIAIDKEIVSLEDEARALDLKEITRNNSVEQYNVGQKNSTDRAYIAAQNSAARAEAVVVRSNKRAAQQAGYGELDDQTIQAVTKSYADEVDPLGGMMALQSRLELESSTAKGTKDRRLAYGKLLDNYTARELEDPKYNALEDPSLRYDVARANVEHKLDASEGTNYSQLAREGQALAQQAGGYVEGTGTEQIPVAKAGSREAPKIDLSEQEKAIRDRQAALAAQKAALTAPELEQVDMIDRSRDIYWEKFGTPGYEPAYKKTQKIEALKSYMQAADQDTLKRLYQVNPNPSQGEIDYAIKKGREDAMVPLYKAMGRALPSASRPGAIRSEQGPMGPVRQEVTTLVEDDGMTYTLFDDGVIKISSEGEAIKDFSPGESGYKELKSYLDEGQSSGSIKQIGVAGTLADSRIDPEQFRLPQEDITPLPTGRPSDKLAERYLDISAVFGEDSPESKMVEEEWKAQIDAENREAQRATAEQKSIDKPFTMPIEERGGEAVPFFRKPGGAADVRELEGRTLDDLKERREAQKQGWSDDADQKKLDKASKKAAEDFEVLGDQFNEEPKKKKRTIKQEDDLAKTRAAVSGGKMVDDGSLRMALEGEAGVIAKEMWELNNNAGDADLDYMLKTIAETFADDPEMQADAAAVLFALSLQSEKSKRLRADDRKERKELPKLEGESSE
jgi:hypothetical protein